MKNTVNTLEAIFCLNVCINNCIFIAFFQVSAHIFPCSDRALISNQAITITLELIAVLRTRVIMSNQAPQMT